MSVLEVLSAPLEPAEHPGLETVDPRFVEVTDLVAQQKYRLVAERVERLVEQGVYDIRLIVQYLYSRFDDEGLAAAGEMFECLAQLLGASFEALGPAVRREQHSAKSVIWLCHTMSERIAYHANKEDERWRAWQCLEPESLTRALAALDVIGERLTAPCFGDAARVVGHLARWLREVEEGALSNAEEAAAEAAENGTPGSDEVAIRSVGEELGGRGAKASGAAVPSGGEAPGRSPSAPASAGRAAPGAEVEPIVLQGSYPLRNLLQKLAAFESLIQSGKFDRAALVCDDVHALMDNFDPREYFPELFLTFSRLLAENIGELEMQWQHRDGTMWNAMRQFARVDLKGFVDSH